MVTARWTEPVEVGRAADEIRVVTGPAEALTCLTDIWPDQRGPRYVKARSVCRAAIDGRKSVEDARAVFLSAAEEAQLHAH